MKIKENEVIEDVMKMEVLSVQNQFQGHFGMIGSTKVRGKFIGHYHSNIFHLLHFKFIFFLFINVL